MILFVFVCLKCCMYKFMSLTSIFDLINTNLCKQGDKMTLLSLISSIILVGCDDSTKTDTQEVKETEDYSMYCDEDPSRNLIEEDFV